MARSIEARGLLAQDLREIRRSYGLLAKAKQFLYAATREGREELRELVDTHFVGKDAPLNPWNKPITTYRLRRRDLSRGCIGREVQLEWGGGTVKIMRIGKDKVTGRVSIVDKGFSKVPEIRIPTY